MALFRVLRLNDSGYRQLPDGRYEEIGHLQLYVNAYYPIEINTIPGRGTVIRCVRPGVLPGVTVATEYGVQESPAEIQRRLLDAPEVEIDDSAWSSLNLAPPASPAVP